MSGLPYLRKLSLDDFKISVILSFRVLKYGNMSQKCWELNTRTFSFQASCVAHNESRTRPRIYNCIWFYPFTSIRSSERRDRCMPGISGCRVPPSERRQYRQAQCNEALKTPQITPPSLRSLRSPMQLRERSVRPR